MDLWQLQIFCKVVELASFSKAGQAIHLSQPTVSSHIKDLEQHFGCPLIDRLSRHAVPTKAGALLYTNALRLLALRDETESIMAEFQGHYKGRLAIGGSTIPGGYLLPEIIGRFNGQYPHIQISLTIGDSHEIAQKTLAGEIELGVIGTRYGEPHLVETTCMHDMLKLIVPGDHPWAEKTSITIKALQQEPMIVREAGSGTLEVFTNALRTQGFELANQQFNIIAEIGNTVGIIGGIKSGLGISILSTRAVEDDLANGTLKALNIDGIDLRRDFYLVSDERRTLSPLGNAFQSFIMNHVGNTMSLSSEGSG